MSTNTTAGITWIRLSSSSPSGVAVELAILAGDVVTEEEGALIAEELLDRGLLRRRGSAAEIVEIAEMTETEWQAFVAEVLA